MPSPKPASVVPWYNPDQFHKVYKALYSSDVTSKRWAVDQISVWETRCHPALPTGIEASVVITRAIVQDILFRNTASLCQEEDVRMIYSMSLVRFINITLELEQNAPKKLPLSLIAEKLGIPSWILYLRHQATHTHCPSLPVLRAGAETAMLYLKKTFWEPENNQVQSCIREMDKHELTMFELISSYKEAMYKELKEEIECTDEIKRILGKIRAYLKSNSFRQRFIELFAFPGIFIFNEEELYHILDNTDQAFLRNPDKVDLPNILEYFWDKIILLLVRFDLIGDLVELLLLNQDQREPLSQKLAIAWVLRIFQVVDYGTPSTSNLLGYFNSQGIFFNWHRILYACIKHPCEHTPVLLAEALAHLDLKEKWVTRLGYLIAVYQGQALTENSSCNINKVYTVKDVIAANEIQNKKKQAEKKKAEEKAKRNKAGKDIAEKDKAENEKQFSEQSLWSRAPENIDFATLPIGAILNPVGDKKKEDVPVEEEFEKFIFCDHEANSMDMEVENGKDNDSEEERSTSDDEDSVSLDILTEDNIIVDMVYKRR